MHPALSIIVFSTLSGLGYGLAAMLGLGLLDAAETATKIAHLTALALIGTGLFSSTFHLRSPVRAWRAFSQWRSSWLSREGVLAVAAFMPLLWSAAACWLSGRYLPLPGVAGALLAAATVHSTSMIYASLRAVDAWHSWLTPACYLLFAAAGGLLLGTAFGGSSLAPGAASALIAAWAAKLAWWARLDRLAPGSTPETATGLGQIGTVRLFERPHTNENYLTREMGYRVARKHARKLRRIALIAGGALPLVLLILGWAAGGHAGTALAGLAAAFFALGVFVERWLFFAEARHAVMNYYGG